MKIIYIYNFNKNVIYNKQYINELANFVNIKMKADDIGNSIITKNIKGKFTNQIMYIDHFLPKSND